MKISISAAGTIALLGYAVVFVGLSLLMIVVILLGKIMHKKFAETPESDRGASVSAAAVPQKGSLAAPGSAGEIKLFDVPDKEAAMLMAIVADKMGKPLNELRFMSIKEVK